MSGCYQLEASTNNICGCFDGWANLDWFSKKGRSHGFNKPTRVNIGNISFGIKYPYQFSEKWVGYLGIGPSVSKIWLKNKTHCGRAKTSKFAGGGILKVGVQYFIGKHLFTTIFADYLYQPANFKTHVDIGGLKIGAGLGIRF